MRPHAPVSVIIPTLANAQRAAPLQRAIGSIRQASREAVPIHVVVNGPHFDPALCQWLLAQPDVRFQYQSVPSSPLAVWRGRQAVRTAFFATLDDDDELLPGALDARAAVLAHNDTLDLVIGNGFRHRQGADHLWQSDLACVSQAPLAALMAFNWLSSCNALYRSSSVGEAYFENPPPFAEWTWLAFRLGMDRRRIGTLNTPGFRCHDTAGSLSKSGAYQMALIPLLDRMLACQPPADIARQLQRKRGAAWHDASVLAWQAGRRRDAFSCHAHSLLHPGGLRYLSYTRHLLRGALG
jgi:hypothetical protein